jgi:hypothetical protein
VLAAESRAVERRGCFQHTIRDTARFCSRHIAQGIRDIPTRLYLTLRLEASDVLILFCCRRKGRPQYSDAAEELIAGYVELPASTH